MTDTSEMSLHLWDYWRIIANRRLLVSVIFSLVLLSTVVATYFMPKIYRASVTIQVVSDKKDIDVFDRDGSGGFDPYFQQTQFANLNQKDVLYPVIDALHLGERWGKRDHYEDLIYPRDIAYIIMIKRLDVKQIRNTALLEIQFHDPSKQEAAEVADAIAKSYANIRQTQVRKQMTRGLEQLDEEVKKQEAARQVALNEVERLRKEYNITEVTGTGLLRASEAAPMAQVILQQREGALSEAKVELMARRNRVEKINELSLSDLQNALTSLGIKDENLQALQSQYFGAEANVVQFMKEGYDVNHPKLQSAEALVVKLKQQLDGQISGLRSGLQVDLATQEARVEQMEKELEEFRKKTISDTSEKYSVFREAMRKFETQQGLFDAVSTRYKQRLIESEISFTPIIIRSPAESLPFPVKPNWKLNIILGVVVGLVFAVASAFFIEYLDTSVKSIDDVERSLKLKVLGVIPKDVPLLNQEESDSPHAEGYRILRTKVESFRANSSMNTLTIVSGGAGEGKSTTLFNLAWVCAQSGMMTIIVDCDMYRPSMHKFFNTANDKGLKDLLVGNPPLEDVVQGSTLPTLHFLPSGQIDGMHGLINSRKMLEIIADLKSRYEWVFFDSPPILGVSDASVLVRSVDCALIVIQHRRYPLNISQRVKQAVLEVGGNLLGVVLNQVSTEQDEVYGYYNSYYSYYGKQAKKSGKKVKVQGGLQKKVFSQDRPTKARKPQNAEDY